MCIKIYFQDGLEQNHRLENAEPLSRGIRDSSSLGYLKVIYLTENLFFDTLKYLNIYLLT